MGLVILMALVFSVAAYAVLFMVMSLKQRAGYHEHNLRARYAAEAGMVWAMQQLWINPNWTSIQGNVDKVVDTSGDGIENPVDPLDTRIDVVTGGPCSPPTAGCQKLEVGVQY